MSWLSSTRPVSASVSRPKGAATARRKLPEEPPSLAPLLGGVWRTAGLDFQGAPQGPSTMSQEVRGEEWGEQRLWSQADSLKEVRITFYLTSTRFCYVAVFDQFIQSLLLLQTARAKEEKKKPESQICALTCMSTSITGKEKLMWFIDQCLFIFIHYCFLRASHQLYKI